MLTNAKELNDLKIEFRNILYNKFEPKSVKFHKLRLPTMQFWMISTFLQMFLSPYEVKGHLN
jgi:hypothetical protein